MSGVGLGVPPRKASGSRFPLYSSLVPRCGVPLQSLTRISGSMITFLFGAFVLFTGCSDDNNTSFEDRSDQTLERSEPEGKSCNDLPISFTSYTEAMEQIRSASFRIAEEQYTDESSWVRNAEYYSCDGATGFFIIRTDDQDYIHNAVPLAVWQGFKEASSFGSYYNTNIKRRYRFGLN